jgi:hypothetical protein
MMALLGVLSLLEASLHTETNHINTHVGSASMSESQSRSLKKNPQNSLTF